MRDVCPELRGCARSAQLRCRGASGAAGSSCGAGKPLTVIAALEMAIDARPQPGSLVHHADRGPQYACSDYTGILNAHGITTRMSRVANGEPHSARQRIDGLTRDSVMRTPEEKSPHAASTLIEIVDATW